MNTDLELETLARETLVARHKAGDDGLPAAAVELGRRLMAERAAQARGDEALEGMVCAVSKGLLAAVMLLDGDLPTTAQLVLEAVPQVAAEIEPARLMTWAMEGIAPIALLAGPRAQDSIERRIDERFSGAGTLFIAACGRARALPS